MRWYIKKFVSTSPRANYCKVSFFCASVHKQVKKNAKKLWTWSLPRATLNFSKLHTVSDPESSPFKLNK